MTLAQIRGALLEVVILKLLEKVGYEVVKVADPGCRQGSGGLEVRGRGEWHQIDALALFSPTPAFMYPLRLMVEAKCYKSDRKVGIEIPRNSLGVLRDIQENYFTIDRGGDTGLQIQRFNYHSAIFSTSQYTSGAQNFAVAHQIFLITYEQVPIMKPIADTLLTISEQDFMNFAHIEGINVIREVFNSLIESQEIAPQIFSESRVSKLQSIKRNYLDIRGSYFGMLQGRYPMHLVSNNELPSNLFTQTDEIQCMLFKKDGGFWRFAPSQISELNLSYFELEFSLPKEIARIMDQLTDKNDVANMKRGNFSYIDLSGKIGNVRRTVRLRLDDDWLSIFLRD